MMYRLAKRFWALHWIVKIIWVFCLLGMLLNVAFIMRDMQSQGVLMRLHIGFFILYAGQVVFILWGERMVCVLSLVQAMAAFLTNLDFTFVPFLRVFGNMIYGISGGFSLQGMEVYKYVFVSLAFTVELFKTWCLWELIPRRNSEQK